MKTLFDWLLDWRERIAKHLTWLAPLFDRIVVGWVFMWSGWGKLRNLPAMIENLRGWGIPSLSSSHRSSRGLSFSAGFSCCSDS